MNAHTPGPWSFDRKHPCRENDAQIVICTDANHPIAILNEDGHVAVSAWLANANLIAAAPDLLSMLRVMTLLALNGEIPESSTLNLARATIAKATGSAL